MMKCIVICLSRKWLTNNKLSIRLNYQEVLQFASLVLLDCSSALWESFDNCEIELEYTITGLFWCKWQIEASKSVIRICFCLVLFDRTKMYLKYNSIWTLSIVILCFNPTVLKITIIASNGVLVMVVLPKRSLDCLVLFI